MADVEVVITPTPPLVVEIEEAEDVVVEIEVPSPLSVVDVLVPGPEGPEGPQGIPGPPGEGGDLSYVHDQALASAEWQVEHSLSKFPSVMVADTSNRIIYGDVTYIDANNVTISFSSSVSGKAYLN
jgi:hypothetical protein